MPEKTYSIEFEGYWREPNIGGIPDKSGVYCVYTCVFNQSNDTVDLKKLVYLGESENVNTRIKNHEKWNLWRKYLKQGEQICFSYSYIDSANRDRVEAALIYEHKPPVNDEYVNNFPFDRTTINTSGRNAFLHASFTVL